MALGAPFSVTTQAKSSEKTVACLYVAGMLYFPCSLINPHRPSSPGERTKAIPLLNTVADENWGLMTISPSLSMYWKLAPFLTGKRKMGLSLTSLPLPSWQETNSTMTPLRRTTLKNWDNFLMLTTVLGGCLGIIEGISTLV